MLHEKYLCLFIELRIMNIFFIIFDSIRLLQSKISITNPTALMFIDN